MALTRVALVTASSAGLGAAIAKSLISDFRVVINYNSSADRAQFVLEELQRISDLHQTPTTSCQVGEPPSKDSGTVPRFLALHADISSRTAISQLVGEVVSKMGRLDVVVSNGGWTKVRQFGILDDNVEEDDWDRCWNMNVKSHLWLLYAAKVHLEQSENGAFISVASVAGVRPSGSSIAYAVSKAAQIHLVKSLALAVGPKIRVNSVSPGILMTDWGRSFPEGTLMVAKERTVLKRFSTVEDVADQVKCLAMSKSMTGVNVIIDSGFNI